MSLAEIKNAPKQLALGLGIMLLSSLAGGAILSTQNQTETLLVLNRDVAAGDAISLDYFDTKEVLVSALNTKWLEPDQIDSNSYFTQSLSKGDPLRAADISKISSDVRMVSFAVEETDAPSNLKAGDLIDFWEITASGASPIAFELPIQSISYKDNLGEYQVTLLVNLTDIEKVLTAVANESFALATFVG